MSHQHQAFIDDLAGHLALFQEALHLAEQEHAALRNRAPLSAGQSNQIKTDLLSKLTESVDRLRKARVNWQKLSVEARSRAEAVYKLVGANQDMMLRTMVGEF